MIVLLSSQLDGQILPIDDRQDEYPIATSFHTTEAPADTARPDCALMFDQLAAAQQQSEAQIPEPTLLPDGDSKVFYLVLNLWMDRSKCSESPHAQIFISGGDADVVINISRYEGTRWAGTPMSDGIDLASGIVADGYHDPIDGFTKLWWDHNSHVLSLYAELEMDQAAYIAGGLRY